MARLDGGKLPRREIDHDLDLLEQRIEELRVLYEQYFIDVLPQMPEQLRKEVKSRIRKLVKAPFKNSATRFRLRSLEQRYRSYEMYWERVLKQREEGTYVRDVFKAEMREKAQAEDALAASGVGAAERGLKQLYDSYESAVKKTGASTDNINFDAFKRSMIKRAKDLKQQHGVKKLHYKIVVKGGKVIVKASTKK